MQLGFIIILYSVYMNLKEWILWLYAGLLLFNLITGILSFIFIDGSSFYAFLVVMLYYILALYVLNLNLKFVKEVKFPMNMGSGIKHMLNTARGK